jgi:hypothetical protein
MQQHVEECKYQVRVTAADIGLNVDFDMIVQEIMIFPWACLGDLLLCMQAGQ